MGKRRNGKESPGTPIWSGAPLPCQFSLKRIFSLHFSFLLFPSPCHLPHCHQKQETNPSTSSSSSHSILRREQEASVLSSPQAFLKKATAAHTRISSHIQLHQPSIYNLDDYLNICANIGRPTNRGHHKATCHGKELEGNRQGR